MRFQSGAGRSAVIIGHFFTGIAASIGSRTAGNSVMAAIAKAVIRVPTAPTPAMTTTMTTATMTAAAMTTAAMAAG